MAACALSCITSPSLPVRVSLPLPGTIVTSAGRRSPPCMVTASPLASPISLTSSLRFFRYLGIPKYRKNRKEDVNEIGLANGLAETMHGGDLLPAEVTIVPGKGKLTLTGKLGEVMQESAQAAMSYIRSRCESLGLVRDFQLKVDIHVHFPEGAIPKDGPSAGITMATAVTSALLRIPVRQDIAMTGEITLRGRVLPIGGLKEKILAAHRAEIFDVIIPSENEKDLKDIPKRVLKEMTVHPVTHMDEVLKLALAHEHPELFLPQPTAAIDWRLSLQSTADSTAGTAGEPH